MQRVIFPTLVTFLAVACGGAPDQPDQGEDDVSAASYSLVTVRRDERRCAAPACGGFWVYAAQDDASPVYAVDLDFSRAGLSAQDEQVVREAPAEELILKGRLSAADKRGFRRLVVKDAWRGMPGIVPAAKDVLYTVAARTPARACVAAPCNDQVAKQLSTGASSDITRVSVERAARAFVDQEWLRNRVVLHGALVAAHLAAGAKLAAGTEAVLDASQVWLHIPEVQGPCAKPAEKACGANEVKAYDRTADRCVQFAACVQPGVCAMMIPGCPDGYVKSQWVSAPNGCVAAACDPAWVVQ